MATNNTNTSEINAPKASMGESPLLNMLQSEFSDSSKQSELQKKLYDLLRGCKILFVSESTKNEYVLLEQWSCQF